MTFKTNVLSSHLVTRAFIPLLKKGNQKKVINMYVCFASPSLAIRDISSHRTIITMP